MLGAAATTLMGALGAGEEMKKQKKHTLNH